MKKTHTYVPPFPSTPPPPGGHSSFFRSRYLARAFSLSIRMCNARYPFGHVLNTYSLGTPSCCCGLAWLHVMVVVRDDAQPKLSTSATLSIPYGQRARRFHLRSIQIGRSGTHANNGFPIDIPRQCSTFEVEHSPISPYLTIFLRSRACHRWTP